MRHLRIINTLTCIMSIDQTDNFFFNGGFCWSNLLELLSQMMLEILPNPYLPVTIKNHWELEKESCKKLKRVILIDFKDTYWEPYARHYSFLLIISLSHLLDSKKVKLEKKGESSHLIDFIILDFITYCIYCIKLHLFSVFSAELVETHVTPKPITHIPVI